MNRENAQCHCGNISADIELTQSLSGYTPRACDCSFCTKHGAAYMSDAEGKMHLSIISPEFVSLYTQGEGLVELYICKTCGVLVAVTFNDNGRLIGGINSKTLNNLSALPAAVPASPQLLSADEKVKRWQEIWFPDVTITHTNT